MTCLDKVGNDTKKLFVARMYIEICCLEIENELYERSKLATEYGKAVHWCWAGDK